MELQLHLEGTSMRITATIDTRAAARGEEKSEARELAVDAATYEEGRDELFGQIPEGWLIIGGIHVPDRTHT